ncbi:MAG: hypothetical protein CL974_01580 [Euryarchaeota archaeon]|nr:hypothetical protein [Euryarchaeota archaeon]
MGIARGGTSGVWKAGGGREEGRGRKKRKRKVFKFLVLVVRWYFLHRTKLNIKHIKHDTILLLAFISFC